MKKKVFAFLAASFLPIGFHAFAQEAEAQADLQVQTDLQAQTQTQDEVQVAKPVNLPRTYKVGTIKYTSKGITNSLALKHAVEINTDKEFSSRKDLDKYTDSIVQQLKNKRLFDEVTKTGTENEPDENGVVKVDYEINVVESNNFLIFPKPNYSSNNGFELKLKLKDTNFLGSMNTLNLDLNSQFGTSSAPDDFSKVTLGTNFDYAYPFQIGPTRNSWNNKFSISWLIGSAPEFTFDTGLTTAIPFDRNKVSISFTQSVARKNKYEKFGDTVYLTEKAGISVPLTLGFINNTVPLRYTPSVTAVYNWDPDGLDDNNKELKGPALTVGHNLAFSTINWQGNFRDGYSFTITNNIEYNFSSKLLIPSVTAEMQFFKAFKYVGINSRFYAYGMVNKSSNNIGSRLRGIIDNQSVLSSDIGMQFSLDIPIHIFTTDWLGWAASLFGTYDSQKPGMQKFLKFPRKVFGALNFELQLSPFIDVAFTKNSKTGRVFHPKDGFYDAGIEILLFPTRFKSYQIRGSIGVDLGRTLLKNFVDTSWRDPNIKKYEISIGLGLHY